MGAIAAVSSCNIESRPTCSCSKPISQSPLSSSPPSPAGKWVAPSDYHEAWPSGWNKSATHDIDLVVMPVLAMNCTKDYDGHPRHGEQCNDKTAPVYAALMCPQ